MKTISQNGIELLKRFEGLRLIAYDDLQPSVSLTPTTKIKGTLTIGWGHTGNVKVGDRITREQADALFLRDLERFIGFVNNKRFVPFTEKLNQNQFDALVSFAYNAGQGNLRILCRNDISEIGNRLLLFNRSKGIVLPGLTRRRQAEKELFERIDDTMNKELQQIQEAIAELQKRVAENPPPKWFTDAHPDAVNLLNQKTGTTDFWRIFALVLRINGGGK